MYSYVHLATVNALNLSGAENALPRSNLAAVGDVQLRRESRPLHGPEGLIARYRSRGPMLSPWTCSTH